MVRKRYAIGGAAAFLGLVVMASANPDINGDGAVNSSDLAQLIGAWGDDPPPSVTLELVQETSELVPIVTDSFVLTEGPYEGQPGRVVYLDAEDILGIRREINGEAPTEILLRLSRAAGSGPSSFHSQEEFEVVWQRIAPLKGWPETPPPVNLGKP